MNEIIVKDKDCENFQINCQMKRYDIKQPNPNTFHISTGYKWLLLLIFIGKIILILFVTLAITGNMKIDQDNVIIIFFSLYSYCSYLHLY